LARLPHVAVAEARAGALRLTGQVRSRGDLLRGPITRRPCVAFHLVVEQLRERGWVRIMELADARPFRLADDSGEALVDTANGPFALALFPDRRGPKRGEADAEQAMRSLLESAGFDPTGDEPGISLFPTVRYREGVLSEGRRTSVGGVGAIEVTPDGERGASREAPQRLVLRGTADQPLLISDWRD
jgi:hypothetical protein